MERPVIRYKVIESISQITDGLIELDYVYLSCGTDDFYNGIDTLLISMGYSIFKEYSFHKGNPNTSLFILLLPHESKCVCTFNKTKLDGKLGDGLGGFNWREDSVKMVSFDLFNAYSFPVSNTE